MQVKQPVYIDGNAYLNDAMGFAKETHAYFGEKIPDVMLEKASDGIYLNITLPKELFDIETEMITTDKLGLVRIVNACYENPDGGPITVNCDLCGNARSIHPVPGPLESVHPGKNRIRIF